VAKKVRDKKPVLEILVVTGVVTENLLVIKIYIKLAKKGLKR